VRYILQKVFDSGDIYFSNYKGLYCVGCERFYAERELVDGKCPDHDSTPIEREEANYFFRMGKYQEWLIRHIEAHPDFIRPERYRNEVLAFLREPLEDLCISRPKQRLSWGIPLPFDDNYVTYVWFDALINYVSAIGYPEGPLYHEFWPSVQHTIAKDILKPHGIYWPTMIKAAGIPLFQHLNVHGYWRIDEGKMSKSKGTVVRPLDLVSKYGVDAFRYFLLREMVFGLDANFSEEALVQRLNADLANDLGNLFSRTLAMTDKYFSGEVPPFSTDTDDLDDELRRQVEQSVAEVVNQVPRFAFHKALMAIWECLNTANKYVDRVGPWNLFKDASRHGRLQTVIRTLLEVNKVIAVLIAPFMPHTAEKILERLGCPMKALDLRLAEHGQWGTLTEGKSVTKGDALFPRIDSREQAKKESVQAVQSTKEQVPLIPFDRFKEIDLRVGIVKHAQRIPKSKKLMLLTVDIGEERQVVAGIGHTHAPEDVIGKQIILVANLQPAKIMGHESHGMILAAHDGEALRLVTTEGAVAPGAIVS
jgi:methionyl-tRNA synthetase